MEDIIDSIADLRVEYEVNQDFDVSSITDFDKVSDKIAARLYGMEGNEELLSVRPHTTMDDLAVTYCIMLGNNENGSMSVPITNQIMETWGVTQEDLQRLAKENCDTLTPSKFMSMNAVIIKHYRVDKMIKTDVLDEKRTGEDVFKKENMAQYTHRLFGMFDGEESSVELLCDNSMTDVIFDRFGLDTPIFKQGNDQFKARVKVAVSSHFFGWVMALERVKIIGPDAVVEKMKKQLMKQYNMYFEKD